jgi:hypothetical protein
LEDMGGYGWAILKLKQILKEKNERRM